MDEYEYLEAQLEGKTAAENGGDDGARKQRSRDKERSSRDKEKSHKHRDRDRDRDRDRSKERDKRHRSSSRHEKDRERDRDRDTRYDRDSSRQHERDSRYDRDARGRGRDRPPAEYRRPRERTPPEVHAARAKEDELKELERTVRTCMCMNLNLKAEEEDIFNFFAPRVGNLLDIKIIKDKNTKRSKGIAYVEFETVESAIAALSLNGQLLLNMPVLVKPSEAEKNLQWEAQQQAKQNQNAAAGLLNQLGAPLHEPIKLQILNLHPDVDENELKELFIPFGTINYLHVVRDAVGVSTGEAYVQYTDRSMADKGIQHFNNYDIGGRKMTVQIAPVYAMAAAAAVPPVAAPVTALPPPPGFDPAALAMGMMGGPPQMQPQQAQAAGQVTGEVDDLEEAETRSGFRLNAQSRVALMSRLANSAGLQAPPSMFPGAAAPVAPVPPVAPAAPAGPVLHVSAQVLDDQGLLGPASPIPTPCLLLKNMFTEADKADPNWQADVVEDVTGEASKFGQVAHCYPDPNSANGNVYLKFSTQQAAEAASRAFHGRYYSGRQIVCSYQFLQPYTNYFHIQ